MMKYLDGSWNISHTEIGLVLNIFKRVAREIDLITTKFLDQKYV